MVKRIPKVVETIYAILVNGELTDSFKSLREARKSVQNLSLTKETKEVQIVKQCVSHTLLDTFKPEISRVLVARDFDWDGQS